MEPKSPALQAATLPFEPLEHVFKDNLVITRYGDFKHGSRDLNFEKPKDHPQEDRKQGFIQSSPAVCGLEKSAVGEAVCYTDPFESPLRFREEFFVCFCTVLK